MLYLLDQYMITKTFRIATELPIHLKNFTLIYTHTYIHTHLYKSINTRKHYHMYDHLIRAKYMKMLNVRLPSISIVHQYCGTTVGLVMVSGIFKLLDLVENYKLTIQ